MKRAFWTVWFFGFIAGANLILAILNTVQKDWVDAGIAWLLVVTTSVLIAWYGTRPSPPIRHSEIAKDRDPTSL